MNYWMVAAAMVVVLTASATSAGASSRPWATLRIQAPADMEFRTLGLPEPAFTGPAYFTKLDPGTYVVVQAPPYGPTLSISCTDGGAQQHELSAGDDVVCTFGN